MSRIEKKFRDLKKRGSKAFVAYITAGDPGLEETEKIAFALEAAGVDVLEIGIPFSDPTADGPVIQEASQRAIRAGATLPAILDMLSSLRNKSEMPVVLFSYYNPIFFMGAEAFARRAAAAGADGVLVVDLPPEESGELTRFTSPQGLDFISLIAPTSGVERMRRIARKASGFIYYISVVGITGSDVPIANRIGPDIEQIRHFTRLPVVAGFGISSPGQAQDISRHAEGIVVGSALVRIIHENQGGDMVGAVGAFALKIRQALG